MTKKQIIEKWVALLVPSKDITLINAYKKYLTEDLNSLSLPPAEGAEEIEILMDKIIYALNEYAKDYDNYEYGLPVYDNHLQEMRDLISLHAQKLADKMVSERFDHLINEVSKDDDVFDKMNCLIGYLERWWNNPQSYPPVELKSVIDEAIEYLKSREHE